MLPFAASADEADPPDETSDRPKVAVVLGGGGAIFYRQLRSNPLRGLLNAALYVGGSLEVGNAWQNSSDVSFKNSLFAGSLFVGADTFIGPVYFAGGPAEGGHSALYLYVGKPY